MEIVYTVAFETWLKRLRFQRIQTSILVRIERIQDGNFGDHRSVGQSVNELRVHVGRGYRVYYTVRQRNLVVLLFGGDKSNQPQDISIAQRMAKEI